MSPDESKNSRRRVTRSILFAVIILAVILRIVGMGFGLPQKVHPDESLLADRAIDAAANGNFKPDFYHWPSFMIYLLWAEYMGSFLIGKLTGVYTVPSEIFNAYFTDPTHFFWIGRLTTTLFCVFAMVCIYLLVKKLGSAQAGLAACILLGFNALFVEHSRYITPDVPAVCLMLYVLVRLLDYSEIGKRFLLYGAAFVGGVAMSTKYNAGLILVPILIAAANRFPWARESSRGWRPNIGLNFLISVILFFLGYIIFTPYTLLDIQTFIEHVTSQASHQSIGHIGMETGASALVETIRYFLSPYGIVILILAIAGLPAMFRNFSKGVIIAIVPILYLIVLSRWVVWADRYILYLLPFLFIPASISLGWIGQEFVRLKILKKPEYAVVPLTVLLTLPSLIGAINHTAEISKTDTRVASLEWIEENIPERSYLFRERGTPEPYHVDDAERFGLDIAPVYQYADLTLWLSSKTAFEEPLKQLKDLTPSPEYIISSGYSRDRYFKPGILEKHPELVEPWIEYYTFIDENCEEIIRFEPGPKYTGPWIRIYHLPPDALYDD